MSSRQGFRMRALGRALATVAACLGLLALPGCLTDGSIPVGGGGGTGVLRGVVVHADDPGLPYVGAKVTVRRSGGPTFRAVCDEKGAFELGNVPNGWLEATFEGAEPGQSLPVRVMVETDYASFSGIAVALAPATLGVDDVSAISLSPRLVTVNVGDSVPFQAEITGGIRERKAPTWIVEGGIGSINARGEFQALRAGSGKVRAVAGKLSDSTFVTVAVPGAGR